MRTTVNLDEEAYDIARAVAFQKRTTIGRVISETLIRAFKPEPQPKTVFSVSPEGLPQLSLGRTITPEDVAKALEEQ